MRILRLPLKPVLLHLVVEVAPLYVEDFDCDALVTIPMYGSLASLNASVAGALVMYEAARQRHRN